MSDEQIRVEAATKLMTQMVYPIIGLMALKWIVIIGLNRWARSIK